VYNTVVERNGTRIDATVLFNLRDEDITCGGRWKCEKWKCETW